MPWYARLVDTALPGIMRLEMCWWGKFLKLSKTLVLRHILPYDAEYLSGLSTIYAQEARLQGLMASSRGRRLLFIDVRITHPKAFWMSRSEVLSRLKHDEQHLYCVRVNLIHRHTFTTLVFSKYGVCGPEASLILKY